MNKITEREKEKMWEHRAKECCHSVFQEMTNLSFLSLYVQIFSFTINLSSCEEIKRSVVCTEYVEKGIKTMQHIIQHVQLCFIPSQLHIIMQIFQVIELSWHNNSQHATNYQPVRKCTGLKNDARIPSNPLSLYLYHLNKSALISCL